MNLLLHQLRIELRRGRVLLGSYLLLLFCNYTVAAGWIGQPEIPAHGGHWGSQSVLPGLFILGYWALLIRLVAQSILFDSPATRDRFLATRPMPKRVLYAAKTLYIALAGILPAVILEILSLRTVDAPASIIAASVVERLFLLAVCASFVALFTAHWKSTTAALIAAAVSFGFGAAAIGTLGAIFEAAARNARSIGIVEPTLFSAAIGLLVISLGLGITARLNARRPWKYRHLAAVFTLLFLLGMAVAIWFPLRYLPRRLAEDTPANESLESILGNASFEDLAFQLQGTTETKHGPMQMGTTAVTPRFSGAPDDWELRWYPRDTKWLQDGRTLHRDDNRLRPGFGAYAIYNTPHGLSPALMQEIRAQAPKFRSLSLSDRFPNTRRNMWIGGLEFPADAPPKGPVTLDFEIAASAYRWELAARLPVRDQGVSRDGPWQLAGFSTKHDPPSAFVSLAAPQLPTDRPRRRSWSEDLAFVLHVPEHGLIQLGESWMVSPTPSVSAAKQFFGTIRFGARLNKEVFLTPGALRGSELLVFEATKLAGARRSFRSRPFTMHSDSRSRLPAYASASSRNKTAPAAFARWMRQHADLPVTIAPDDLKDHLLELLNQTASSQGYFDHPQSAPVQHLARFVPQHLKVFLEILAELNLRQSEARILTGAITQGARAEQKSAIIAALPDHISLFEVVKDRGWLREARPALGDLVKAPSVHQDLPSALVALNDPTLDQAVLDFYQSQPSVKLYNILRSTPRLNARAEELTQTMWSPGFEILGQSFLSNGLTLALAQGRHDALAHFYERLSRLPEHGSPRWRCGEAIANFFVLPATLQEKRHDHEALIAWIRDHKPEHFRFDPVQRGFALLEDQTT